MTGLTAPPHALFTVLQPRSGSLVAMDDPDDLYDLRSFDVLPGVDLALWLRLALCLAAAVALAAALLAL